jgi:PAS domain S-box-containing protein
MASQFTRYEPEEINNALQDSHNILFEELFNLDDIQRLQDEFAMATGVASIITHTDGTPITRPSNFCRLCIDIIRKTDQGLINCFNSDAEIGRFRPDGPTIQLCLSGGLWDAGAAISVGGRHIANWLIGQVRDETQTEEKMREYAYQIGANEDAVLDAFRKVPAMSRLQFGRVAQVLFTLAQQLSTTAYQNVQQARFITKLKQVEEELRKSEQQQRQLLDQMSIEIAERKRVENVQRVRLRLIEYAGTHTVSELIQKFLDEAEALTDSQIGFYHFLEDDQETLLLQGWSTNTIKNMCKAEGTELHYSLSQAGVWVECVLKRAPVIHNDYASLPHKKGMPEGHAPVIRELLVPVTRAEKIVAILGVGNKSSDYQAYDVKLVQELADLAWEMIVRKHAEEALRKSEERFRVVFERSPLGKSLTAPDGKLLQINQAFADLLGYTIAEMQQLNFAEVTYPDDLAKSRESVRCLLANEQSSSRMEKRYIHKSGKLIWTEVNTTLLRNEDGTPLYFITSIADINERVRAAEELQKYHEQLEDLVTKRTFELLAMNKELESFSYSASHDLRAPLRAMAGFSQIFLEEYGDQVDEVGKGYLLRIQSASQRMGELIDNMLKLARITRAELNVQTVNLSELVRTIIAGFSQDQPERRAEMIIQDGIVAQGDKNLLTIALENLLGNAWKFTSKQSQARIEFGMTTPAGERVYFVCDNGTGFDMQYVEKLFIPFQRLHLEKDYPGTGIGLSIVQRIVQRHGGRIWVEAEVGKGATFYFTIR